MNISSLQCAFPCNQIGEQTKFSRNMRITAAAIGVLLIIAAIVISTGVFGNVGADPVTICGGLGVIAIVISICVRCRRTEEDLLEEVFQTRSTSSFTKLNPNCSAAVWQELNRESDFHFVQAKKYLHEGKLSEALAEIKLSPEKAVLKDQFIFRITRAYLNQGNLENAFNTLKSITSDIVSKEVPFLVEIATAYLKQGDRVNALKVIKEIHEQTEVKESFLATLAQACLDYRDRNNAFIVIKEISFDTKTREDFLAKLSLAHFVNNEETKVLEVIEFIARGHLLEFILKKKGGDEVVVRNLGSRNLFTFSNYLANECYQAAKIYLQQNDAIKTLQAVKEKAIEPQYVEAFLNLRNNN